MGRARADMGTTPPRGPQEACLQSSARSGAFAERNAASPASNKAQEVEKTKGSYAFSGVSVGVKRKRVEEERGEDVTVKEEEDLLCGEVLASVAADDEETESEVGDSDGEEIDEKGQLQYEEREATEQHEDSDGASETATEEEEDGGPDASSESPRRQPRGSRYAALDAPADEALMQAVLAAEPQFADKSQARLPLWGAIARKCGSRFEKKGPRAQRRVDWLVKVWKQSSHPERSHLTETLRACLKDYSAAKAKRKGPYRGGVTSGVMEGVATRFTAKNDVDVKEGEVLETDAAGDDFEDEGEASVPYEASIQAERENFISVVLKHALGFATTPKNRGRVWDTIAKEFPGRYKCGLSAQRRMASLFELANQRGDRSSTKMPPKLREMIFKVMEMLPTTATDDARDDLLLQLVLKKRPFALSSVNKRSVVWREIANAVQNPSIVDGNGCQRRLQFLVSVYKRPNHHCQLTPSVHEKVGQYIRVQAEFQAAQDSEEEEEVDSEEEEEEVVDSDDNSRDSTTAHDEEDPQPPVLRRSTRTNGPKPTNPTQAREEEAKPKPPRSINASQPKMDTKQEPPAVGDVSSLTTEVAELKKIQHDQREEFRSITKILQDERESHLQETSAMLKLIKDELKAQREDHRLQFAAMMECFSHSSPPSRG